MQNKQAAAFSTHWLHHCCMGDGQQAGLPDQQRVCRRRLGEVQVRQILGSLLTPDPISSCLDPLFPWRVFLEDISQDHLQVVRGRGCRRIQALALPPVFTCQITCVTPKLPCRHDEQAQGLIQALLISPGIELWEVTCSQVVFKQDHRACQIPAQMIVTHIIRGEPTGLQTVLFQRRYVAVSSQSASMPVVMSCLTDKT